MKDGLVTAVIFAIVVPMLSAEEPHDKTMPAEQYQALVEEYREVRKPREFAGKFLELAKKYPQDAVAVDALGWVVTNVTSGPEAQRAVDLLTKEHVGSEKLGPLCQKLGQPKSLAAEKLLRNVMEKSPHREVKAQACFQLAALLGQQAAYATQLKTQPDQRERIAQFLGEEYTKHIAALDLEKLDREREKFYETIVKSYADVKVASGTMSELAKRELFDIRHLSIGKVAPEIEGQDIDGVKVKLSDYRGKVVLLDFWGHW
jgi:hypothetical protein